MDRLITYHVKMSRGFVKEDDQEEAPFIPPRAPLPAGAINLVTPRGYELLDQERRDLENERRSVIEKGEAGEIGDDDRRRQLIVINGKLDLVDERIATAQIIQHEAPPDDVRFGTTVTFRHESGPRKGSVITLSIVGVDEANIKEGRVAFTAPIVNAMIGKRAGESMELRLGDQIQRSKILKIEL